MIGSPSDAVRDNPFALYHNKIIVPTQQKYETKQKIAQRYWCV